ncbi:MAG TPA: flagellar type III secretion system pore protein FliP [Phycisphaerales bacterium]|nr:flagellar type III secretion system pore protein FliP [Phycisphaerales bacterium]
MRRHPGTPLLVRLALAGVAALMVAGPARAQELYGPPVATPPTPITAPSLEDALAPLGDDPASLNPLSVLAGAARALPRRGPAGTPDADPQAADPAGLSPLVSVVLMLTVVSLVPSILLMCTCFVRMIVVLGLLKQALGTQQLPPSQVILGLALFMTLLVMSPTIARINTEAVAPYRAGEIRDYDTLWARARQPLRDFMFDQIEATGNWSSLYMVLSYRGIDTTAPEKLTRADVDMVSLIPAYMLSELKTAFLMGFRVYLPFLVIDMVIASLLISMSMMMLPPVLISLPFKLLLFVLVDGWQLVVGSLMTSFVVPGATPAG